MANRRTLGFIVCAVLCTSLCVSASAAVGPISPWTRVADMHVQRGYHTMTVIGGDKILVVGGIPIVDQTKTAEIYDTTSNSWIFTSPTVFQHAHHQAVKLNDGRVMIVGGLVNGTKSEIYDPISNTWTAAADMSIERYGHTATLMQDGRVLVAGGWQSNLGRPVRSVEIYDPGTDKWTVTSELEFRRAFHAAVLLPSGKVLVAGGNSGAGSRRSIEIYDPAKGYWTRGIDMNDARAYQGMVAVQKSGQTFVVAVGGCCVGNTGTSLATAEVYSPLSGRWYRTADMATARMEIGIAALANGNVIVAGGENQEVFKDGAELLDMGTRTFKSMGNIPVRAAELPLSTLGNGTVIVTGGTMNDDNIRTTEAVATIKP